MIKTDHLNDDELAATAFVWRQRLNAGDRQAQRTWELLDQELRSRLGATPSNRALLEKPPVKRRAWWQVWL